MSAPCRTPSVQSRVAREGLQSFLLSTNPALTQWRVTWGLSGVDTAQVILLSDHRLCSRASAVLDSVRGYPKSDDPVFVFAVGPTRYAVDPGVSTGKEMRGVYLFDKSWVRIAAVAVPNVAERAPASAVGACYATNELATYVRDQLRQYVTATGISADNARAAVELLSDVADSVYTVSNESLCHRAAVAVELLKSRPDTSSLGSVLLTKAGSLRFGVSLYDNSTLVTYVVDTSFVIMGALKH